MDPSSPQDNAEPTERISALVNEFFERRQAGENLTPDGFMGEHPDVAEQLRPYLPGLALVDKVCMVSGNSVADEAPPTRTKLPSIGGYALIREIGRGGMGVVYKALQVSTKRVVALKVMLAGSFASRSAHKRFQQEVELAARFQHPSIVRILESGRTATGQQYYAMDHVAGVPLNRYLATSSPEVRTVLRLFVQICEAVEYAHGHGVVHRDLKPGNILIDAQGQPHLLDFGLAKAIRESEQIYSPITPVNVARQIMGTWRYAPPEQLRGESKEIDARTDVYALGVMLFEALTGSLPFDTTGWPAQAIQRILETAPSPPSVLSNRVDADLEMIILKTLEKAKARRYQSAQEMAEDLRRYLEGEPILARGPSSAYVLRKKLRKHRLAVVLGALAVALGLIGLLAGAWSRERDLAQARRDALRAQGAMESQTPKGALGPTQLLYAQHPELPEAALVWAQAFYRNERPVRAFGVLQEVLDRDPSRWDCRALLAEFYRAAGDIERASGLQRRAERDAPDSAEAWYLRSFATLDVGRALQCVQEAVQRQPSHVLAWERLTWLRLHTDDLDGALRGVEQLIELGRDVSEWTLFKGYVLVRQGRFREAIAEYTRVGAYAYRAHVYRRVKEYEKAVADYTMLVEPAGQSAATVWHYYQRATPLWILGRTDQALEDLRRVRIMLGRPIYSEARRYLILREQGRRREAQEVLAAALGDVEEHWLRQIFRCLAGRLSPEELVADGAARNNLEQLCEAYYYAGEVCLLSGQRAEAHKWFEKCVQTGVEFDPDTAPGTPMNEYELAQWRLDSLFTDKNSSSHP